MKIKNILEFTLILALLFLLCLKTIYKINDPDLGLHLKTGEYILKNQAIPKEDPFTWTAKGKPWLSHSWLSAIIFYLLYLLGGPALFILFKTLVISATFLILYRLSRRLGANPLLVFFLSFLAIQTGEIGWSERAQMFTFLFLAILFCRISEMSPTKPLGRLFWEIPLYFILWVNLHIGFSLGLFLLFLFILGELTQQKFRPNKYIYSLTALLLLSLVASLLNPHIYNVFLIFLKHLFSPAETRFMYGVVREFFSPFHPSNYGLKMVGYLKVFLFISGISFVLNFKRLKIGYFLIFIFCALSACSHIKAIPPFVILALPITGFNLVNFWKEKCYSHTTQKICIDRRKSPRRTAFYTNILRSMREMSHGEVYFRIPITILMVALVLHYGVNIILSGENRRRGVWEKVGLGIEEERFFPRKAVKFIEENKISGRIFNAYEFGDYLIWKGVSVFIDGRGDVYRGKLFEDYVMIQRVQSKAEERIEEYKIDFFLLSYPTREMIRKNLHHLLNNSNKYALVYWDDVSLLYLRRANIYKDLISKYEYPKLNPVTMESGRTPVDSLFPEAKRRVKEDTSCAVAYTILARLYEKKGEIREAIFNYAKAISKNPYKSGFHNNLANCYYKSGNYSQAIISYKNALKLDPQIIEAYGNLGYTYETIGDYKNAIKFYKRSLKVFPLDEWVYNRLGYAYLQIGQRKKAREAWRKAVQINPNSPAREELKK
ncbi:MAG: tetratricopeptide repeat protein [Candidatus Edwardsbacteria bacterium]